ncbi:MAG: hypothetical protein HY814_12150 [Candidatus Riflebacteria bacterium]|nr:hypothetical protein [Candidatus Riflebacteria bacterium]
MGFRRTWLSLACSLGIMAVGAGTARVDGAPPSRREPVPDLSILDVKPDRFDFRKGENVLIQCRVSRNGYVGEVRVRCFVDTGRVDQIASNMQVLGTLAVTNWTATYDAGDALIVVGAYVEPLPGEADAENNGLWRAFEAPPPGSKPGTPGRKYSNEGHRHITEEGIKLAGIPEVMRFADRIVHGALAEDRFPDPVYGVSWFFGLSSLWTRHFWDVDKGEQGRGLWGRESAYQKARAYLYGWPNHPGAIDLYKSGNPGLAYEYLGRAVHLMEDLFSPAHVHLDVHMIDDDECENEGETRAKEYGYEQAGKPYDGATLYQIMYHGGQLGDSLPSDDAEGDLTGLADTEGWAPLLRRDEVTKRNALGWDEPVPAGMKKLFDRAMPAVISHVAGVIRLFWLETHPGKPIPGPVRVGD